MPAPITEQPAIDPTDLLAEVDLRNVRYFLQFNHPGTNVSAHVSHDAWGVIYRVYVRKAGAAEGTSGQGNSWKEALAELDGKITATAAEVYKG